MKMAELVVENIVELPTQKVLAVGFHPDGERIAAGDRDGYIHILERSSGRVIRTLGRHVEFVYCLAFDPDTGHLITSGKDKSLRVWDLDTGAMLYDMAGIFRGAGEARTIASQSCRQGVRGHTLTVLSIACAPGGLMATGGQDCKVKYWKDGEPLRTYDWHSGPVTSVRFEPETGILYSGSKDQTIRSWNEQTGAVIHKYSGHISAICGLEFVSSGAFLSIDVSGMVLAWETAQESMRSVFYRAPRRLMCSHLDRASGVLLLGGEDGALEAVAVDASDLESGAALCATRLHTAEVRCIDAHGSFVVSGDNSGRVVISRFKR